MNKEEEKQLEQLRPKLYNYTATKEQELLIKEIIDDYWEKQKPCIKYFIDQNYILKSEVKEKIDKIRMDVSIGMSDDGECFNIGFIGTEYGNVSDRLICLTKRQLIDLLPKATTETLKEFLLKELGLDK